MPQRAHAICGHGHQRRCQERLVTCSFVDFFSFKESLVKPTQGSAQLTSQEDLEYLLHLYQDLLDAPAEDSPPTPSTRNAY